MNLSVSRFSSWVLLSMLALMATSCQKAPATIASEIALADVSLHSRLVPGSSQWKLEGQSAVSPGWLNARSAPVYDLATRLPARADQPIEIGLGQSDRFRVRLTQEGASPSSLEIDDGRSLFMSIFPSTDGLYIV